MGAAKKLIDKKVLRELVPINALSPTHIEEISRKAIIDDVRASTYVFKLGDQDNQTVYLLEGRIEFVDAQRNVVDTLAAGTEAARHPIAHQQPRQLGARAAGKVTVARVDSNLLDVLLTWDESAGYDVVEIESEDDDDWMTRMLQSEAFLQLPPSNIHQLLMRLEAIEVNAGDVIVRQGDEGDYFYIVKRGRLAVSRKASANSREVLLAELGEGACFGEEALVSGTKRNASVTMLTNGALMRLSKQDFGELLCAPLVHEADFEGAQKLAAKGAKWLDVRLPGEFGNQAITGSTNLPLSALREQCSELDKNVDYIVCCDTGRRSAAAAFVLSQRGFKVYTLKNGLMGVPADALTSGPAASKKAQRDAEIIPFDTESRPETGAGDQRTGADTALIDKLAAVENDKLALEKKLAEAQRRTEAAEAGQKELRHELDAGRGRLAALEGEKGAVQDELARLQQSLTQAQASAEGKDDTLRREMERMSERLQTEQQSAEKHRRELEDDLARLREDYRQLGQRTSAVAGERDAANRELKTLREQLGALQDQQSRGEAESRSETDSLRQGLNEREAALEAEREESRRLRERVEEIKNDYQRLEERLASGASETSGLQDRLDESARQREALEKSLEEANQQAAALQAQLHEVQQQAQRERGEAESRASELGGQLRQLQQQIDLTRNEVGSERDALSAQVEQLQQELAVHRQEREQLAQQHQAASAGNEDLAKRVESLQQVVDEREQRIQSEIEARQAIERQLTEAQDQIAANGAREQELDAQSRQVEERSGELRSELDKTQAAIVSLESELAHAKQRRDEADARNSELEARLLAQTQDNKSDLASAREAMSRAQTETENVKREQTRLMESLRKAERALEHAQHDHEAEIRRLHKELKSAAGESSAGLAAEMEALQGKLKEGQKDRDELEIKLGERSAQLEDVQAEVKRLALHLQQAQASAREAEQQLLESTQAANEEMAVRMEAEEKAQQALRTELAEAISERNRSRERLTVQTQEIEDLRSVLEAARQETEEQRKASRDALAQMQAAQEEAVRAHSEAEQQIDRLRAEAEINRGLGDMHSPAGGDEALREQLDDARKHVEEAARLRSRLEERNAQLEAEVRRLQMSSQDAPTDSEARIPSLDDEDPHASTMLSPDYADPDTEPEAAQTPEPAPAARPAAGVESPVVMPSPVSAPEQSFADTIQIETPPPPAAERSGAGLGKLLGTAVVVIALVAGGAWWVLKRPTTGTGSRSAEPASAEREPAVKIAETTPAATASPTSGDDSRKAAAEAREDSKGSQTAPSRPVAKAPPKPLPAPPAADRQPVRTYSERLRGGGRGPQMVELHADSFDMGSGGISPHAEERPRHRVQLKQFAISKHEVTFDDYARFARATGRRIPSDGGWGRGGRPVINVSWKDARAYASWLSKQTGSRYRLPTEAEWEYAARSGSGSRFWWGFEAGKGNANCFDCQSKWSGTKTAPAGSFAASPYGIQDMAGNVMEWVEDCYHANYSSAPADGSAVSGGDCSQRVVRGGAYDTPSDRLRSTSREAKTPGTRANDLGFRVVKE